MFGLKPGVISPTHIGLFSVKSNLAIEPFLPKIATLFIVTIIYGTNVGSRTPYIDILNSSNLKTIRVLYAYSSWRYPLHPVSRSP